MRAGKPVEIYTSVPSGSTLEVRIGPANGAFTCAALFAEDGPAPDQTWTDAMLRPGPKTPAPVLGVNKGYWLEPHIRFLGNATATIDARIPGYSEPIQWTLQGTNGQDKSVLLLIRTV